MSKMVKAVKEQTEVTKTGAVTNFMGGTSYELNPLDTLKMITASSIFGEPQYYRNGEFSEKGINDGAYRVNALFKDYSVLKDDKYAGKKTSEIMEIVIDEALSYDFGAVLDWAVELRQNYFMRLNPQVIMVRASIHPARINFTSENPNRFNEVNQLVMQRADEPALQATYYLYRNGKKNKMPMILKRSLSKKLSGLKRYSVAKYKNAGIGMINTIRLVHANSPVIDELMKTGTVEISENQQTWENMRSAGKKWAEILKTIDIGHMALLRNLRNIFEEINDRATCIEILTKLKSGVAEGKQFPFRYWSARQAITSSNVNHKPLILDALNDCIDISCSNMPTLAGKTMCLTDNSGSAWGSFNSEYGSVTVAEIDNLSSLITARNSDEGYIGVFGDTLEVIPVSKRDSLLTQVEKANGAGHKIGGGTENGIWLFFDEAIREKQHWDNIFIYSDQQAGHGGLYGLNSDDYRDYSYGRYIDVAKLIKEYRNKINPDVNVFSVQTAGYTNVVVPEYGYRTNIMYGWTGKELVFADAMINFWNNKTQNKQ